MPEQDATTRVIARADALVAKRTGLFIRWSAILGAIVVCLGAAGRYADARWTACEQSQRARGDAVRAACDRTLVLEQQMAAAQRTADERHSDLKVQLSQIQAQLAQIQIDLRRHP